MKLWQKILFSLSFFFNVLVLAVVVFFWAKPELVAEAVRKAQWTVNPDDDRMLMESDMDEE